MATETEKKSTKFTAEDENKNVVSLLAVNKKRGVVVVEGPPSHIGIYSDYKKIKAGDELTQEEVASRDLYFTSDWD